MPNIFLTFVLLLGSVASSFILARPAYAAECPALPAGSQSVIKVNIAADGAYRLWLQQITPTVNNNAVFVQVDNQCGVAIGKNQAKDTFEWIGSDSQNIPFIFRLAAGEHTVTLAGDQTGIGVDRGVFTVDQVCTPQGNGENCRLAEVPKVFEQRLTTQETAASIAAEKSRKTEAMWVIMGALAAFLCVLAFFGVKYAGFIRRVILPELAQMPQAQKPKLHHVVHPNTLVKFYQHHQLAVINGAIIAAAILIVLALGVAASAVSEQNALEADAGTLSGDAKIVQNAGGGAYVVFGSVPGEQQQQQTNTGGSTGGTGGSTGGGGNNGGGNTGGGNSGGGGGGNGGGGGGGGGGTPAGECPAFPAFPDENCTGWQHTGVTLHECATDGGYIWDSNLVFDSCYFPQSLTIYGSNITITRSQVHGTITPHWSKNYDFGGLTLRDVEIEETGNPAPASSPVAGHNFSCLRCNVHHTGTGMHAGNNTVIQDSYTHDFIYTEGAHGAGIGMGQGHGSNSVIRHNNIQCNRLAGQTQICSSALSIYDEINEQGGTVDNILIEKNLFNTVGAYCTYAGGPTGTNIKYIDNYFGKKFHSGCGGYGPVTAYAPNGGVWTGNIWADGSGPVNHP